MAAVSGEIPSSLDHTPIIIRAVRSSDVEACARAAFSAHTAVAAAHNVPCEHPSLEFPMVMIANKVKDPNAAGFVAERGEHILGSIFLSTFPDAPVAAIGPLTVAPPAEGHAAGRRLMLAALEEARAHRIEQVRLVQSPSHLRSLVLYAKLGFEVREPLVLVTGKPPRPDIDGCDVRPATADDLAGCDRLCTAVHGFSRGFELRAAVEQQTARVVRRGDQVRGYSTGLGFRGHAVGETTADLKALISLAPAVTGPGFFVPIRGAACFLPSPYGTGFSEGSGS